MTIYRQLAHQFATTEALDLAARLSAWHDSMVQHERLRRLRRSPCHDECPHADAPALWEEARQLFGDRAHTLTFLRSRSGPAGGAPLGGGAAAGAR
jgi:hypothetical protein